MVAWATLEAYLPLVYMKDFFELEDEAPIILAHLLLEVQLQKVNGFAADFAHKSILHVAVHVSNDNFMATPECRTFVAHEICLIDLAHRARSLA